MIFAAQPTDALVDELARLLDREIELLNRKAVELDGLTEAIIERDDDRMQSLLGEMEQTHLDQRAVDVKLEALRNTVACDAGCRRQEVVLSQVMEALDGDSRASLDYRRQQILILADQLRRKHLETVMLLAESARINRLILAKLFPQSQPLDTYGTAGGKSWRDETGFLDTEV